MTKLENTLFSTKVGQNDHLKKIISHFNLFHSGITPRE